MIELFIAYRHIKERKFQTFISIISVALSLIVFIVSLTISNGLKENMINSLLTLSPHISIKYTPKVEGDYKQIIKKVKEHGAKTTVSNVYVQGFVKYNDNNYMPIIRATEIEKLNLNLVKKNKVSGIDYAYIGQEMAKDMHIKLGDDISVASLNGREIRVKVQGFFKTGFLAYDSNLVIMPLEVGQILEETGNNINSLDVRVEHPGDIKSLNELKQKINSIDDDIQATTWADENENLLAAVHFEEFILILILSMLFLISSFIVSIILNILIREKTSDIGILKACGYTKGMIKRIFIIEGSMLGIGGIILSAILSPIVLRVIQIISKNYLIKTYYISNLIIKIDIKEELLIYAISFLIILLASYLPSRKAAKLDVTEAIRFNL
ncbi:ABC transporter permease [Sneathia sp. DSM 16631]|uniref:ABC transporter permease n=1 Tax=Sneathia TaxID=168808 RepID=UPI001868A243|nr:MULTISPECIES: FtsX-like permease family protein [Sneathia]MBE3031076.1 ABC transporter permease [Sneathia sp. DSM 16631]MDK9581638.1 FtsX-like permease family protein [Sneathia vaginalis]